MATAFRTSRAGYDLIKHFEGCKLKAYKPSPADNWTIGWGQEGKLFPGTPAEIPVTEGLVITQQQADDALAFFVVNVVEPLVNSHFTPDTQGEFDALVSWTYNIRQDKLNRGEYSLPEVFNRKPRDYESIIEWWLKYVNPKTMVEQGLYRRRLAELCLMFGWPWKFATSAVLKRVNGVIQERTDPDYILKLAEAAAETAKAAPIPPPPPKAPPAARPAPDAPVPPVKAEPKAAPKPAATVKKPPSPNTKAPAEVGLDPNAGLKHISETERGAGFFWQKLGIILLKLSGAGLFGNTLAIGSQALMQDEVLLNAVFELWVPLAVNGGALASSYVAYFYGQWKLERGRAAATQAVYI